MLGPLVQALRLTAARLAAPSRSLITVAPPSTQLTHPKLVTARLTGALACTSRPPLLASAQTEAAAPVIHTGMSTNQIRTYKCPSAIKKRCAGCYIVRRKGRLFVECKLKPRHKQMQRMSKKKLFRED